VSGSAMAEEHRFVYDLLSELRKDPNRRGAVMGAMRRIDNLTRAISDGKAPRSALTQAQADLIPLCGFNFGLLIPTVFPKYPRESPLDLAARPFMFAMTSCAPASIITLKAGRQVGKCADGSTVVTTNTGDTTLRDLFEEGVHA
jgi:hypothetical protein